MPLNTMTIYKYLPFKTVDGVNEKGLYIGVNVMPTGETSFDPSTWEPYAFGHGAAHTNPSSDMHYSVNYLVRIVLDRAANVEDAKRVIEFMDNKAVYTAAPNINEPSLGNIMTNFTNCFTIDPSSRDFWFTEWYDAGYSSAYMYKNYELCENDEFCNTVRRYLSAFNDPKYWHVDDSPLWYTTHTSVYDLKARTLRVLVHEGRDGQTQFYQASLDGSEFPKPLEASN